MELQYLLCFALSVSSLDQPVCFIWNSKVSVAFWVHALHSLFLRECCCLMAHSCLMESLKTRHLQKRTVLQTVLHVECSTLLGTPSPRHTWFQRIFGARVLGSGRWPYWCWKLGWSRMLLKAGCFETGLDLCRAGYMISVPEDTFLGKNNTTSFAR